MHLVEVIYLDKCSFKKSSQSIEKQLINFDFKKSSTSLHYALKPYIYLDKFFQEVITIDRETKTKFDFLIPSMKVLAKWFFDYSKKNISFIHLFMMQPRAFYPFMHT